MKGGYGVTADILPGIGGGIVGGWAIGFLGGGGRLISNCDFGCGRLDLDYSAH